MLFYFNMETFCVFTFVTWSLTFASPVDFVPMTDTRNQSQTGPENVGYYPTQHYMNSLCNQKLLHRSRKALIISPWTNNFPPSNQTCAMGVEEKANPTHQFVITFNTMDLYEQSEGTCIKSRLDMFNGQSFKATDRISGDQGVCGSNTEKSSYETTTAFLTLKYETSGLPPNDSQSFEAVITPFHYGECKHDEFKCSNAKCIHNDMRCDSYNNCGNDSDEKNCSHVGLTIAAIVGIVLGSVALVAIVIGFFIAVCCCGLCNLYDRM